MAVDPGETIIFETQDALGGQIVDENSVASAIDWNAVNPATGPVYINGAEAGDVLAVHIHSITVESQGAVMVAENSGFYGDLISGIHFKIAHIHDGIAEVAGLRYKQNKMIGVIGVAPAGEGVSTGVPGSHGGNMDNKMITEGSSLFLPVSVSGALFGLGDLHAVMADGEVGVTGIEVAGEVSLSFEVIKRFKLNNPLLEDVDNIYFIGSAKTLDAAAKVVLDDAMAIISTKQSLPPQEVAMLLTLCGNLQICQIVDPLVTVRLAVAKEQLKQLDFVLQW